MDDRHAEFRHWSEIAARSTDDPVRRGAEFALALFRDYDALAAENAALRSTIDDLTAGEIHTCHDHCQRTACILRRENDALAARLAEAEADNARLVAANKARDEFLRGHRYKHSEVDGYIDLCESQMADLKAQLAEAQDELAQWRATGESVTRNEYVLSAWLAEVERLLQEVYDGRQSLMSVGLVYRIGHTLNHRPADSATHRENESHG